MATYRAHSITCFADGQGSAVHVPGIISKSINVNPEIVAELTGSATRPKHTAMNAIDPLLSGSLYSLKTALDIIGTTGFGIDSDTNPGLTMYLAQLTDMGDLVGGSTDRSYLVKKGAWVPRRLTCNSRGDATLEWEVYCLQKGSNDPVVISDSATLPTIVIAEARWTLGPIDLGGVVLSDYNQVTIDFGLEITPQAVESAIYNKYLGVKNQIPTITIQGIDPTWWSSSPVPIGGAAVTHANSNFYLRKRTQDGAHFVANGTAEHIKFTFAGLAAVEAVNVTATSLADTSLRIQAVEDSSGNAPLIVDTASAIS